MSDNSKFRNDVVNSGRVAAQRLQTIMDNDDDRNKKRSMSLLEAALGMENVVRSHQKLVDDLRGQIDQLSQRNLALENENAELIATIDHLVEVTNQAAIALEAAEDERDGVLSRINDLVKEAEESITAEGVSLGSDEEVGSVLEEADVA